MTQWSLKELLGGLHDDIQRRLSTVRTTMGHPGTKGDANERAWLDLLQLYLPKRYQADKAHVVDSAGRFSEQIDVVIFDRQYSPFIFHYEGQAIVPAESVYAVFEAKQTANSQHIEYARQKVRSVRSLHRTSLPVPHVGGTYPPKPLGHIFGGILTFESDWSPPLGKCLLEALGGDGSDDFLDLGCVAAHGFFCRDGKTGGYAVHAGGKPATSFLFKLISLLQSSATVPMIDLEAYAKWLK